MKKIILLSIICLCIKGSFGQHKLQEHLDSLSAFKVQYYYEQRKDVLYGPDTSIRNLEEYNFVQREEAEYHNLGNVGNEAYSIMLQPLRAPGFSNGLHQFDLYWINLKDIKYYTLKRPFSELTMNIGLRQELNFRGSHSQNIGKNFNFGFYFNRLQAKGYYQRQQTIDNNISLYGNYLTKNQKFRTIVAFVLNSFKTQQNGGVKNDFINDPDKSPFTKELLDVNLENANSNYRDMFAKLNQAYEIGYKYDQVVDDTLTVKKYQPLCSINYEFGIGRNRFNYVDKSTTIDSNYYQPFFYRDKDILTSNDTLSHSLRYARITNQVSFEFLGYKKVKGSAGKPINLMAGASLIHENYELTQNFYEKTFNNLSVKGYFRSNELANKKWNYLASAQFFLSGYNLGDIDVRGGIDYNFKKAGKLYLNGVWSRQAPSWIENHYHNFSNTWDHQYKKINTIQLNAIYSNLLVHKQAKVFLKACVNYYLINNYIFWNTSSNAVQLGKALNIANASISLDLSYRHVHLDNYIMLQSSNRNDVIQMPKIFAKVSLYYESMVFKKALYASIGVDMRYFSDYYANNYNPLIGQFYLQDQLKMHYLPVLDLFVNMKVKTVRLFLKGNNLLQGIGTKGYYTGYLYPADERSFKFGVTWRFLD